VLQAVAARLAGAIVVLQPIWDELLDAISRNEPRP
jgi:hypothetical protein